MKLLISGIGGHMGNEVLKLAMTGARGVTSIFGVDPHITHDCNVPALKSFAELDKLVAKNSLDVIVDFSHHTATKDLTDFAIRNKIALVIATTGQTDEEKDMIKEASKSIPVFFAANFSLGVALLIELAKKAAATMTDAEIEIVETHHDRKVDAPSGTAWAIANGLKEVRPDANVVCGRSGNGKREPNDIGISALRYGNIVGIHEVILGTQTQTITLKHEAHNRALFAEGALAACEFIVGKPAGLYDMNSLV